MKLRYQNTEVNVYLPGNKRDKLSLKWARLVRIIKEKHPSYLVSKNKWLQNGKQEKNLTN